MSLIIKAGVTMSNIQDEFLEDLKPFIAAQALKHFSKIEDFLMAEAEKTATPFDDLVVRQLLSWGRDWLEGYVS